MTKYNRWEIWEANVPFEDTPGSKRRPVLIYTERDDDVLCFKMTSHEPRYQTLEGEYEIMRWEDAGLKKPTVLQCSKFLTLAKSEMCDRRYGRLSMTDIHGAKSMLLYMGYRL